MNSFVKRDVDRFRKAVYPIESMPVIVRYLAKIIFLLFFMADLRITARKIIMNKNKNPSLRLFFSISSQKVQLENPL